MIERTRFAITQDESRYTLSGAKFFLRQRGVRMVATDGTRLSLMDNRTVSNEREFDCLIPKKALQAISLLAAGHEGAVGLSVDASHLYCAVGTRTLVTRLLAGEFPNYEMILPKNHPHQVQLESGELLQTARRVAVLADERNYALRCEFSAGQLRIAVDEKEEGAAEEALAVAYEGEPVAVGLNARYLIEYLSVLGAGPVQVEFRTGREVVEFKPLGEPGFNSRMLLMPLNLAVLTSPAPEAPAAEAETAITEAAPEAEEYAIAA
jgi:DNA polymerase-3 subunit beta